jgi:regulator of protease activity HflC (stomatin/prohibitin superfamily)
MNIATLLTGIATVAWVAFVGAVALVIVRATRSKPMHGGGLAILVTAVIAILMTSLSSGVVFINPQERGLVLSALSSTGYRQDTLTPGIHFIIPGFEQVIRYPISRQTYTMSASTGEGQVTGDDSITARTSDGQEVFIDASVIYTIDPAQVIKLHIEWQNRYQDELVRPQSRGIIRDVVSQYGVEDVVSSKRFDIVDQIRKALQAKLADNALVLVDFVLRNITFSPEYSASIEQKQIADQQAQEAKFVVESKKQEAEQARQTAQGQADAAVIMAKGAAQARLINADAEAKSLQLISQVIKDNPSLLTYQYITKLSPTIQTMLLPSNSPFLFPIPNMNGVAAQAQPADQPTDQPTEQPTLPPTPAPTEVAPTEAAPTPTPAQ